MVLTRIKFSVVNNHRTSFAKIEKPSVSNEFRRRESDDERMVQMQRKFLPAKRENSEVNVDPYAGPLFVIPKINLLSRNYLRGWHRN